LQILRERGFS